MTSPSETRCCQPTCNVPTTADYNYGGAGGTVTISGFNPSGVTCASGYTGSVRYTKCVAAGASYSVSGCEATCNVPTTVGYNYGGAGGTVTISGFSPSGVTCARGHTGSVGYAVCDAA